MSKIAKAAGVSRQAVYLHFQNRANLLLEIVRWIDEKERIFEVFERESKREKPWEALERTLYAWLEYLPKLYPAPSYLARAREDAAAVAAWDDRMRELEVYYKKSVKRLYDGGELKEGMTVRNALDLVRALGSIYAWEFLVQDRNWKASRANEFIVSSVCSALRR